MIVLYEKQSSTVGMVFVILLSGHFAERKGLDSSLGFSI